MTLIRLGSIRRALPSALLARTWTRPRLQQRQNALLRRMVRHAYSTVPYYRDLLDSHGVSHEEIRAATDLVSIPVTDKEAVRSLPVEKLVSSRFDPARLVRKSTSGSSGTPLIIHRAPAEIKLLHLFRRRAWHDVGVRARHRRALIAIERPRDVRDTKWMGNTLRSLGLYRRGVIDAFLPPEEIHARLSSLHPDTISGYPGILARLVDVPAQRDLLELQPRLLIAGGEVLTPFQKDRIERGFEAPVYSLYGCHEVNLLAWECSVTRELHTCDDAVIVEVLKDGREAVEGERGEVVVTSLYSFAMPFIRYRLGDVAVRGKEACGCGAPFSTITEIQGRTFEYFALPGGRVVHAHELGLRLSKTVGEQIKQYQLVQESTSRIVAKLVPAPLARLDEAAAEGAIRALVGADVDVAVELVDEIPPDPTGKTPVYRSLLG